MRGELFAVDLETTGFDPVRDEIIEVAAVRFHDGQIVDTFQSFVNPARPIPQVITSLTGITDDNVRAAPAVDRVMPMLSAFVGGSTWIAHNITFDHGFLKRRGALLANPRLDTFDLASVLLPRAPRYNLSTLIGLMHIDIGHAHRALDDARATAHVYWMLWQKALTMPIGTLREILDLAGALPWDSRRFYEEALHERIQRGETMRPPAALPFTPLPVQPPPLSPAPELTLVEPTQIEAVLGSDGVLAAALPGYEQRPQQIAMSGLVADAFNRDQHIIIEAGTGTGKSLAYLVPSLLWALANGERVVVSTNTINLQEQVIDKDLPILAGALGQPFRAALLKGRGNYLCPRRLGAARRRTPTTTDELRALAKILVWLGESETGDRGEISLRGEEYAIWSRLSAEDEGCTENMCRSLMEGVCPFHKARQQARAAHVVVVNHALLVADALTDNRVLPDYRRLIIDEAHNLEEAITGGLSFRLDEGILKRRLADLGGAQRGLLGSLLNAIRATKTPEKLVLKVEAFTQMISDATDAMQVHIGRLFVLLRNLAASFTGGKGDYTPQTRITETVRSHHQFPPLQEHWTLLRDFFAVVGDGMNDLTAFMPRLEQYELPAYDDLRSAVDTAAAFFAGAIGQLDAFLTIPDANTIYWLAGGQNDSPISLHSAPLQIGGMIEDTIWNPLPTVVLTSATLRTHDGFGYMQDRLNAHTVMTHEVGSPFDYRASTLVYLPTDIPEPTKDERGFQAAVERGIIALADALGGRVLALFTSYRQLRQTAQAITPRLALGGITVFDQSDGGSRQALVEGFKSVDRAVLLGTKSFWEGVDLPGQQVSALVIVKLPFATPTEPVIAARMEMHTAQHGDSFNRYQLPEAVLRFRQGFGRLIRTRTDRGVVTVFDSRIVNKSYGRSFIDALPDCTVERGLLSALPARAAGWLAIDTPSENPNQSPSNP